MVWVEARKPKRGNAYDCMKAGELLCPHNVDDCEKIAENQAELCPFTAEEPLGIRRYYMIMMKKTWKQMKIAGMALFLGTALMLTTGVGTEFAAAQELYGKDPELPVSWANRPEKESDLLGEVVDRQKEESMLPVKLGNYLEETTDILEDGEPETVWESAESAGNEQMQEGELYSEMESELQDLQAEQKNQIDQTVQTDQTDQTEEAAPRKADFTLSMKADAEVLKAGEITVYEVELVNTGDILLTDLKLSSSFSCPYVTQEWQPAVNLTAEQSEARLSLLEPDQTVFLYLAAQLTPEQTNPLVHNVTVTACNYEDPLELLTRESVVESKIDPLKVDFAVEKTADRQVAVPGDTITYQICIRNTGERTLHSIVGTERFLNSGLQARFLEKDGVVLNETKDKAMISSLLPGESITLQAQVTLSKEAVSQELINQITVVTAETGERTITSQTTVQVTVPEMTVSPTPVEYLYHTNEVSDNYEEKFVPRTPKTGDFSGIELFLALLGVSAAYLLMSLALFIGNASSRGHHKERNH